MHGAQTGTVVGVRLNVDLLWPKSGQRVEKCASEKLEHIRPFLPGTYVVHSNWLGRVEEVSAVWRVRRRTFRHTPEGVAHLRTA